jgi:TetR/AcrR family fatty acid metabolism transcriptional regulator
MKPDKRQRIMHAAEKLFHARQFHELTLDDIAREANVGKGTLYLYFSDKNDLFFQTVVAGYDEMCELLQQNLVANAPFREDLMGACETITSFFKARRPLFRMFQTEGDRVSGSPASLRKRWQQRREKLVAALAAVIAHGIATGEVRSDLPAEVLAQYLLGLMRTRAWEMDDWPDAMRSDEVVADLFLNGVATRPSSQNRPKKKPFQS